jgi:hypothetical protein
VGKHARAQEEEVAGPRLFLALCSMLVLTRRSSPIGRRVFVKSLIGLAMLGLLASAAIVLTPGRYGSPFALDAAHPATGSTAARDREASSAPVRVARPTTLPDSTVRDPLAAYGKLPLAFVPNAGQSDARVRYSAQVPGASFAFTPQDARFTLAKDAARRVALQLGFLRANPDPTLEGRRLGSTTVNYIIGRDPAAWHTGLPTYGELAYRNLWPGVDMVFKAGDGRLEYEFLVHPGGRAADIGLAYRGAQDVSLDRRGNLRIETALGALSDTRPVSYQVIDGKRVPVDSRFVVRGGTAYGFAVGTYDPRRPLVIDPGLVYSTLLGGSGADQGLGIAVDATGNSYVTGFTGSTNFPTQSAFDSSYNGGSSDVFVTKLNATGTALVYSTYLGGSGDDQGLGIAVDTTGSAYLTGFTTSSNFPTKVDLPPPATASDTSANGGEDAFVTKLNPTGGLAYSTYLGGSNNDRGEAIAVAAGQAYVTGFTESTQSSFPFTPAALDPTANGGQDVFLTIVGPFGEGNGYSSFLGGSGDDQGLGIALDPAGDVFLTGQTTGSFPTTPGAFDTTFNGSPTDAFVTRLNFTGRDLSGYHFVMLYSTYHGGGGDDRGFGIAVDGTGNAYVTGRTQGLAVTTGAFDTSQNGSFDAFVTKFNPGGTAPLLYSTYLGGAGNDQGRSIAINPAGEAHVTGRTGSTNFPTTAGAFDRTFNGVNDAFVTKFNAAATGLTYSTYLGGSGDDQGFGLALDGVGAVYATGLTGSSDFPTTAGSYDTTFNGNTDAFVTKLDLIAGPITLTLEPAADTNPVGTPHTVTATARNAALQPVAGVTVRFTVTGANPTSGSSVTNASGQATFTYTGTVAGPDAITAYADTNNNNVRDGEEPMAPAAKVWTPGPPATLVLTPAADTNEVGNPHTVTATVRDAFLNPVPNVTVRFTVTGANPTSGSDVTDANGQATFTYTGTHTGTDTITAYADTNGNGSQDAGEPSGTATKAWTPGPPAKLTLTPATATNTVGDPHTVTATVTDQYDNPVPGVTVRFSVSGANTASGADVTDANGRASFTYIGTNTGTDTVTAYADTNHNGVQDPGEPSGTATKHWRAGPPATLTLAPEAATNTVGDRHCVTATLKDRFGNPVPGIAVRFSVPTHIATFAHPFSGSDVTDANGEATFCFTASLPGTDAIHAYADTNNDGTQDAPPPAGDEPFADAAKVWTLPASTEFCEVKVTDGGWIIAVNDDRASFGGNAKVPEGASEVQGQEQYTDHGPADPRDVHSIELTAMTCTDDLHSATIFGRATVDGSGDYVFRIDVTDGGQGGSNDSYGIILSDGYASGQQDLRGGNVTIHKT